MLLDRFLKYVKIDTMSAEDQNVTPSTQKQFDLAYVLVEELKELGLVDIKLDEHAIVTATLPTNSTKADDTIGFIAHMDTIPGFSGTNVNPQIVKNYDGKTIVLKNDVILDPNQFPFMKELVGKTLITTDGTTVLGGDDKAGIADIMSMLEFFVNHPEVEHTTIKVAFTPDEEIGGGIASFDVKGFGATYAYTVDGEHYDDLNYECFNGASARIKIKGVDIHPGFAKGQMINAAMIGCEFEMMMPPYQKPQYTEGYQGYNHLIAMSGVVGECQLDYIIRNHNLDELKAQMKLFETVGEFLNKKYGEGTVEVELKQGYLNMAEFIKKDPRCLERAIKRMEACGVKPNITAIRGGTDGSFLTLNGMNTPNLGTGGYNCHGPYEFTCLEEMEQVVEILIEIAKVY